MHPKKIIKLDPLQKTLFGLLGQQIRQQSLWLPMMAISITKTQFQTEPTKQQTKKVSALFYGLVKTDKMSVLSYVSQVFDHLSQKLKFYENIFINL